MNLRISVGDVEIETDGLDLSKRDVTRLLERAAGIAIALATIGAETEPAEPSEPSGRLDAATQIAEQAPPEFGFTRWIPNDPEIPDEEAP